MTDGCTRERLTTAIFFLIMLPLNLYLTQFYQTSHAGLFPRHVFSPPSTHLFLFWEGGGAPGQQAKRRGCYAPSSKVLPVVIVRSSQAGALHATLSRTNGVSPRINSQSIHPPSFYYAGLYGEGWSMIGDISMDLAWLCKRIIFYRVILRCLIYLKIVLKYNHTTLWYNHVWHVIILYPHYNIVYYYYDSKTSGNNVKANERYGNKQKSH